MKLFKGHLAHQTKFHQLQSEIAGRMTRIDKISDTKEITVEQYIENSEYFSDKNELNSTEKRA